MSSMKLEKLVLNRATVRGILRSGAMGDACLAQADSICSRCGDGYKADTYTGRNRVNARIFADTPRAKADNARNNTIMKAIR